MPNVEKHRPGSFCWIELATSDQKAAKDFYGQLFRMERQRHSDGAGRLLHDLSTRRSRRGGSLHAAQRPARAGCAFALDALRRGRQCRRVRSKGWGTGRTSLSSSVRRCELRQDGRDSGSDRAGLFDLGAQGEQGTGIAGVGGTLCWADLSSPDPASAAKFYSDLFGWKATSDNDDDPASGYQHIQNGEDFIGGILPAEKDSKIPPHWLPYFQVANCDLSAAKAKELGAGFLLPPTTMENVGRMAVIADPQQAVFAVFQPMRKQ